jgi:hypothetical protein
VKSVYLSALCSPLPECIKTLIVRKITGTPHGAWTQEPGWRWYCEDGGAFSTIFAMIITGWVPPLLVVLWQGVVLPLSMLGLMKVGWVR